MIWYGLAAPIWLSVEIFRLHWKSPSTKFHVQGAVTDEIPCPVSVTESLPDSVEATEALIGLPVELVSRNVTGTVAPGLYAIVPFGAGLMNPPKPKSTL